MSARDDIPFELPEGYPAARAVRKRPSSIRPRTPAEGTITPSEREAFNRIFEEIAARERASSARSPVESAESGLADSEDPIVSKDRTESGSRMPTHAGREPQKRSSAAARNIVNVIVQDAEQKSSNTRRTATTPFDPLHPLEQISSANDPNLAFLRFPPSLREAAGIALAAGMQRRMLKQSTPEPARQETISIPDAPKSPETAGVGSVVGDDPLGLKPLAKDIEIEARRRPERLRIEGLMKKARSDFALWDVMENEVFTMVYKLGLAKKEGAEEETQRGKASKASAEASGEDTRAASELSMDIHGPLYSELLLLGLNRMDEAFARSSPLALSILPRIKELGLPSYVLGISTPFYYRLMQIHWHRYGNMTAVLNLLEEMRHAGLYFDQNCLRVVESMDTFHSKCQSGRHGRFLQMVMRTPEFEHLPHRFKHWKHEIRHSGREQNLQVAEA